MRERGYPSPVLVDQGAKDQFLDLLKPEALVAAAAERRQPLQFRMIEGYDHSYFYVASVMEDHVRWHAANLAGAGVTTGAYGGGARNQPEEEDVDVDEDRAARAGRRRRSRAAARGACPGWRPGRRARRSSGSARPATRLSPDGPSQVGPDLYGVVGRTTGTLEGFNYSEAMVKAGEEGHVWTARGALALFLENPKKIDPGQQDDLRRAEEARGAGRRDRLSSRA